MRDAMMIYVVQFILINTRDNAPLKNPLIGGNNRTWQCVYIFTFVSVLACRRLPIATHLARVQLLAMTKRSIGILQMQIRKVC